MKRVLAAFIVLFTQILPTAAHADYVMTTVAEDLDFPWSIAFLPNGDRLVTELSGQLRRISASGDLGPPISGVPAVYRASQGGLFDVLPDKNFSETSMIYLSYAAGDASANATTVARAKLSGNNLTNVEVIFSVAPKKYAPLHYGGRMIWMPDDTLLLTTGDGFDFREQAQNIDSQLGKTIRITKEGKPYQNAAFESSPYVWTYGHRNPQGLTIAADGTVYLNEHGPQGGDEVNVIQQGNNYGWPAITHGLDYNGAYVSPFKEYPGMEQPAHSWVPSIAPSGLMIYEGEQFPEWQGDLFVGALVDKEVRRLDLENGKIVGEYPLFSELDARIRDIRQAPDGSIYVLTDGTGGKVIQIVPSS